MIKEESIVHNLYSTRTGHEPDNIVFLPVSGSYRRYFRISCRNDVVIGVYNEDIRENEAFFSFTGSFIERGLPVPQILAVDTLHKAYLLKDLGNQTLFDRITRERKNDEDFPESLVSAYRNVIKFLPLFQLSEGHIDFSKCYPRQAFDKQSMFWDLHYFKYYFLKLVRVPFDEQKLEDDFGTLVDFLGGADSQYFMYRDFQSRNIMLLEGSPWFIDYQGGRRGALQYDIASLLYDAKAAIPEDLRDSLLEDYLNVLGRHISVDRENFRRYYYGFVLIRILQALGAYGFRGYYENKPHFLKSIPFAVANLRYLLESKPVPGGIPTLTDVLRKIISDPAFGRQVNVDSSLTVTITSFSYKNGIPGDEIGNGGGFVFDCRALPNPGRFDEYKQMTGNDPAVVSFLENEFAVEVFLNNVFSLIDQTVRVYVQRQFSSLTVSFGCTGGQHRSVYCASELASHVRTKFGSRVVLVHKELTNQHNDDRSK